MKDTLAQIKDFADKAHGEQKRWYTSERYIVHPVRVMEICKEYTEDISVLAAALLHDVLEDTPVTKEEIYTFLLTVMDKEKAEKTVHLVEELTDVYIKSNYPKWNRRKRKANEARRCEKTSEAAQTVKYADIMDNCTEIATQDPDFAKVFLFECKALLKKIPKGDNRLYLRTIESINSCIQQLKR